MRRAARVDQNHGEIVEAFRKLGCSVLSLAALGRGAPDILVIYAGIGLTCEIKAKKGKLTEDQKRFWDSWKQSPRIVRDMEGVAETVATLKKWHEAICAHALHKQQS